LDDYEEGTWTPSIGGNATYYSQNGRYVKIGQVVYITMYMRPNVVGTGNANGIISGLPFSANRTGVGLGSVLNVGYFQALGVSVTSLYAANENTSTIQLLGQISTDTTTNNGLTGCMANGTQIEISGTYQATA
jgi:hypothetical protein